MEEALNLAGIFLNGCYYELNFFFIPTTGGHFVAIFLLLWALLSPCPMFQHSVFLPVLILCLEQS